jgi:hypothetical protein
MSPEPVNAFCERVHAFMAVGLTPVNSVSVTAALERVRRVLEDVDRSLEALRGAFANLNGASINRRKPPRILHLSFVNVDEASTKLLGRLREGRRRFHKAQRRYRKAAPRFHEPQRRSREVVRKSCEDKRRSREGAMRFRKAKGTSRQGLRRSCKARRSSWEAPGRIVSPSISPGGTRLTGRPAGGCGRTFRLRR